METYKLSNIIEIDDFIKRIKEKEFSITKYKLVDNDYYMNLDDGDCIVLPKILSKYWKDIAPKKEKLHQNTQCSKLHTKTPENDHKCEHYSNKLIYGKDQTEKIVSLEAGDSELYVYIEDSPGVVRCEIRPLKRWILGATPPRGIYTELDGDLTYKYMKEFNNRDSFYKAKARCYGSKTDFYVVADDRENVMIKDGYTYFKGMKVEDVSVLSFDIETSGLNAEVEDAIVFMISNTYKAGDKLERKLFSVEEYNSEGEMIGAWVKWVNDINPSILVGHNVVSFDFPYLHTRAQILGIGGLAIGRDGSDIKFNKKPSKIRVDGSQSYDYFKINIFGREVIDTWFVSIKYDAGKNFPSYGLKAIIEYLGYEKEGRIKWDFEKDKPISIWNNLNEGNGHTLLLAKEKWEQFKEYCKDDGDDALKLYELMIPSFFYLGQHIPKPFQTITESASGAWLNSMMVRAYLQDGHSIPASSEREKVYGGISFGIPNIYKNVFKVDVKSEYPSIMREYKIGPKSKDPRGYYPKMVDYFTLKRFKEKDLYSETQDRYYNDMQAASKIFINSSFGMLGCAGLNFNDFEAADKITGIGRQIIRKSLRWASGKDVTEYMPDYDLSKDEKYESYIDEPKKQHDFIIGPCDTDSISFCKKDMSEFTQEEMDILLKENNSFLPKLIEMEDDGIYETIVILKAKNYITCKKGENKVKLKGSSIRDTKKEPALREMINKICGVLIE